MRHKMRTWVRELQNDICLALESLSRDTFREDSWERPGGGGGITRIIQDGELFEKAGVNTSMVHGTLPLEAINSMAGGRLDAQDYQSEESRQFFATGLSLVTHPHNPMAPTAHCNYRYFELGPENCPSAWWFGGGADLTPAYLFEEDACHFHQSLKDACDLHDKNYYPSFKRWCDHYFRNTHRDECRGVGGIFFDHLCEKSPEAYFDLVRDCGRAFIPSYMPLLEKRWTMVFDESHKAWQGIRRGRYVEFNLVYDRGTTFGLKTKGRVESILMSLPLTARWEYDHVADADSEEARLMEVLKSPRQWLSPTP
jgi:coproporphyrinogen III oxidase